MALATNETVFFEAPTDRLTHIASLKKLFSFQTDYVVVRCSGTYMGIGQMLCQLRPTLQNVSAMPEAAFLTVF